MVEPLLAVSTEAHCFDIQFHPSRPLLIGATVTGEIELHSFDAAGGSSARLRVLRSHGESCRVARFLSSTSSEGSSSSRASAAGASPLLASASADRFTALTDIESGQVIWKQRLKAAGNALLPLEGNDRFAVGDDSGGLRIFEGRQQKAALRWEENSDFISDLAMGKDGTSLCATSGDGTFAVYDVRKNGPKGLVAMSDFQEDEFLSCAVLKNGSKVVCGSQTGILAIFSWGDFGDQKDRIKGHPMSVDALVKIAEDGILTGSSDGQIRVVSVHSTKLGSAILGSLGEHGEYPVERLSLSPDGSVVASASHGQPAVRLWSTEAAHRLLAGESETAVLGQTTTAGGDVDSSDEDVPKKKKKDKRGKKRKNAGSTGSTAASDALRKAGNFFSGL